jgi:sulfur carrier protein
MLAARTPQFYNALSGMKERVRGVFFLFPSAGSGVQITVNDKARDVAPGTTIAALLAELDLLPPQVAVEVNLELIPRGRHAEHRLEPGDRLEVVTLVGGG